MATIDVDALRDYMRDYLGTAMSNGLPAAMAELPEIDLWVFIETFADGSAQNVGLELLNPGRELANKQGGKLVALVIGHNTDAAVVSAQEHGADQVIVVDGPEYEHYTTDAYVNALAAMLTKYAPTTMLIGATNNGRDVGPRLSSRLQTGLTADCTQLAIDEESGNVAWTRPAFGGNLMARIDPEPS